MPSKGWNWDGLTNGLSVAS